MQRGSSRVVQVPLLRAACAFLGNHSLKEEVTSVPLPLIHCPQWLSFIISMAPLCIGDIVISKGICDTVQVGRSVFETHRKKGAEARWNLLSQGIVEKSSDVARTT